MSYISTLSARFVNTTTLHICRHGCGWLQCGCQLLFWTEPCSFTSHTFPQLLGPPIWVPDCMCGNSSQQWLLNMNAHNWKLKGTVDPVRNWVLHYEYTQWKWRCNSILELLVLDWYVSFIPRVLYCWQDNPVPRAWEAGQATESFWLQWSRERSLTDIPQLPVRD